MLDHANKLTQRLLGELASGAAPCSRFVYGWADNASGDELGFAPDDTLF